MVDPFLEAIGLSGWGLFIASIALHEKVVKPLIDWVWDAAFFHGAKVLKRNAPEIYKRIDKNICHGGDFDSALVKGARELGIDPAKMSDREWERIRKHFQSGFNPEVFAEKFRVNAIKESENA